MWKTSRLMIWAHVHTVESDQKKNVYCNLVYLSVVVVIEQ